MPMKATMPATVISTPATNRYGITSSQWTSGRQLSTCSG